MSALFGHRRQRRQPWAGMQHKLVALALCLCCLAPAWAGAASAEAALTQAQAMLQSGDGQAAYDTLLPWVERRAGQPAFDSVFGRAALAAHKDTRAVMAFNRCIAMAPAKGICRLGLARAHMRLDETGSARRELTAIEQTSPPPEVAQIVQRYLGELAGTRMARQQDFNAWLQLAVGYDSNTNVAPSDTFITLPSVTFIAQNGDTLSISRHYRSAKDSSTFYQARLGFSWRLPVSTHWDLITGGRAKLTRNTQVADYSSFDQVSQVRGHVGASAHYGRQRFGLLLRGQYDGFGGDSYRNIAGVLGQYNYFVTRSTRVGGFAQYSRFDYQYGPAADLRNVDSVSAGLSAMHTLWHDRVLLFAGVHAGRDAKVHDTAPARAASDYYGLRLGTTWLFLPAWQLGIDVLAEHRNYDGQALWFPARSRNDDVLDTQLNLTWHVTKDVALKARYDYIHNHSNIPIRDYDRHIVSFGVRYDFM